MVSVIIPALNEQYLERTIRDVLANARGEIEILVVLDGYVPNPQIHIGDNRVIFIHYPERIGQRKAINEAAKRAKGNFIMKLDAHCAVDEGFDVKLEADCEHDWTVIPRMYNLDRHTWKPKPHKITDYMCISDVDDEKPFRANYYTGDEYKRWHARTELIDDTMCCMGPCFFMRKARFFELGGCDENHEGGWGQQGIEVSLKAWLSGGALKVNKKTWFAHWFRGSDGGFPYPMTGTQIEKVRKYSKDLWLNNKWEKQTRKIEWLFDKFSEKNEENMTHEEYLYTHVFGKGKNHFPQWKGTKIIKFPTDMILYHQAIWNNKPDTIIECGTAYGGSTIFLADMLALIGNGKVISIDIAPQAQPEHPRITYLTGPTTDASILVKVKELVQGKTMVILDSDHRRVHVKRELYYYSPFVSPGQYLVVEDCYRKTKKCGPAEAIDWFMVSRRGKDFKLTSVDKQFYAAVTRGGWLQRQ